MASTPKLEPGRYFGETVRRRGGGGLVLSEVRFAPRAVIPRHSHDRSIFNFVLAGGYIEYTSRRELVCRPPRLLYHPAGDVHWERFSHQGARCLTVEFDPAEMRDLDPASDVVDRALAFPRGEWTWIAGRLRRELVLRDDLSPLVIESYLRILLAARLRLDQARGKEPPPFVERALELLHDRFAERHGLRSLADEVDTHPTSLARAFRRYYHTSPGEYVRRLRVEFACRELAKPERSLAEIAQAAGFADQSHFTRTFKRLTGYTPGHYRSEVLDA